MRLPPALSARTRRLPAFRGCALSSLVLSACAAVDAPSRPQDSAAGRTEPRHVRGSLTTRVVGRRTQGASDTDAWAYLSADVGDPDGNTTDPARYRPWSARFAGRLHADLDGQDGDAFDGLDDANSGSIVGRVYDAWAGWRSDGDDIATVRVGRQSDTATPVFLVWDGVRLESRPLGEAAITVGAFGGASTHQYEASNDGDRLLGLWAEGKPWRGGIMRFDYVHAEDERALGSFEDDLFGVSLRHRFDTSWRASVAVTTLGSDARDLDADATWASRDGRHTLRATYYELLETQSANPLEFDTFSDVLFDWFPYRRGGLLGTTQIGERWTLQAGFDARDVDDDADEGRFNRDVRRTHVTVAVDELLGPGTNVSLTGDDWQSDARDVRSLGATVTTPVGPRAEVALGTYYSAYDVDLVLGTEREDVRTWHTSWTLDRKEDVSYDASYAFQDTVFGEFHTVRFSLRWRF